MNTGGYDREIRIVEDALAQPSAARSTFLGQACGNDIQLRERVESLLQRIDRGDASRELFQMLLPALKSGSTVIAGETPEIEVDALQSLGKYRIERELGRGGQGVVYLAMDETLKRRVALKVLHPSAALETATRQRFLREAGIASRLEHPGICIVYESGKEAGVDYIAMRFVEGTTLGKRIVDQATPDLHGFVPGHDEQDPMRAVAHLVEKIARALHLAHEAGVVHRDVKSGNIIVTPEGEPVILDFGLAREQAPGTTITLSEQLLGTPAFMSPEQISGPIRQLDRRTDVWSLGVVLYQCLSLVLPFEGPTIHDMMRRIRDEEAPPLRRRNPAIPRDLEVIAQTALEKDLTRRYRTALAFAEDLRRYRQDETILARPAGRVQRIVRYARRHPMRTIALALAAVVIALGVGNALLGRSLARKEREAVRRDDVRNSRVLELDEQSTLWPVREAAKPLCDDWLAQLDELTTRRAEHTAALAEMRARRKPDGGWNDDLDRTAGTLLEEHLASLDRLQVLSSAVRIRRERSANLVSRTIDEYTNEWAECIAAIAASPLYHGLRIEPQVGLVPLGIDPFGIAEFWHVESGDRPTRDDNGGFKIDERSGIVLALLPGNLALVGSCNSQGFRFDPRHQVSEVATWIDLDPFFMSKYETTQGQWSRVMDENPSKFQPPNADGGVLVDLSHPVESVNWYESIETLRRVALVLPTDAQWEYACRAGTDTVWTTGDDFAVAGSLANFLGEESNGHIKGIEVHGYRDEYLNHSPVGRFPPNGFGLHDMHGNVSEWCRDRYLREAETLGPQPGDGLREPSSDSGQRAIRGGSWLDDPRNGRSGGRSGAAASNKGYNVGLRAARLLDWTHPRR